MIEASARSELLAGVRAELPLLLGLAAGGDGGDHRRGQPAPPALQRGGGGIPARPPLALEAAARLPAHRRGFCRRAAALPRLRDGPPGAHRHCFLLGTGCTLWAGGLWLRRFDRKRR